MRRLKKVMWEFLSAILLIAVFAFIGVISRNYFAENVVPSDYPLTEPEQWAEAFFSIFTISIVVCGVFNALIIVLIGIFTNLNNKLAWFVYAVLNVVFMVIGPVYMTIQHPADFACSILSLLLFVLEYVLVFCISTYFGPLGFCPFKSTKIRKK